MGWERNYTTSGQAQNLRGMSRGMGGGYAGFAASGYEQEANDIDANNAMSRQAAVQQQAQDRDREMFERNMLMQEQQRRAFDSQSERMGQSQKYGLLGNLLGNRTMRFGG
jgi:hypothetical protein